jgi:hypothetical protein
MNNNFKKLSRADGFSRPYIIGMHTLSGRYNIAISDGFVALKIHYA